MNKKIKKKLRWWIPIIFVSPFLLILIIAALIKISIWLPHPNIIILPFDLSKGISMSDYLSLYAAFAGIGVTLFLGIAIYELNDEKENSKESQKIVIAKSLIAKYIEIVLDEADKMNRNRINNHLRLSDMSGNLLKIDKPWEENLSIIKNVIGKENYDYLYNLFNDINNSKKSSEIFKKIVVPFIDYLQWEELKQINNFYHVINWNLYVSLNILQDNEFEKERKCNYKNGNIFYEEKFDSEEIKYIAYNADGNKIIDAVFSDSGEYSGYMTLYDNAGLIIMQGEFNKGKQISGSLKNAICEENGKFLINPRKKTFDEITSEEYDKVKEKEKSTVRAVADFKLKNGTYERTSDIKYIRIRV